MEAFQLRLWDGRIGRWLSPDPYGQYASPYMGMGNNPIGRIDPDGGSDDWYLPAGETDQSKAVWIDGSGPQKGYTHLGGADFNFTGGWLNNVNVMGTPKSFTIGSSGAYGWNDGSAERFWSEYMPLTSSFHTLVKGIDSGDKSQMAWGAAFLALDIASFGEGSIAIKGGKGIATKGAAKELPIQIHHFATNKSKTFTPRLAGIANEFGLSLNGAWNKQALPHLGRHPNVYHNFVLEGMQKAKAGAGGSQAEFLNLFNQYVKQPVIQNPGLLRKSGW